MNKILTIQIATGKVREILSVASCLPSSVLSDYELCFVGSTSYEARAASMNIENDNVSSGHIERAVLDSAYDAFGISFDDACAEIKKQSPKIVKMPEPYNMSQSLNEHYLNHRELMVEQKELSELARNICSYLYLVRKDSLAECVSDITEQTEYFDSFMKQRYIMEQRNIESVKFVIGTIGLYSSAEKERRFHQMKVAREQKSTEK